MKAEIRINLDQRCVECGKPGASQNGLCLGCVNKAIRHKHMKSREGKACQIRFEQSIAKAKGNA